MKNLSFRSITSSTWDLRLANPTPFESWSPLGPKQKGDTRIALPPHAFTLVELLVCVAIMAVLMAMLSPGLSMAKGKAKSLFCQSNMRQLNVAWIMYAHDNSGSLVPNFVGDGHFHLNWLPGNRQRTMAESSVKRSLLYPYWPNPQAYRCPADQGFIKINGRSFRRALSYPLDVYLGGGLYDKSTKEWLGHRSVRKEFEIEAPAETLTFIGGDPEAHEGAQFIYYPMGVDLWVSFPAEHHSGGCNVAFADGHVRSWQWRAPKEGRYRMGIPIDVLDEPDQQDLHRLQKTIPNISY
jgi:prepilin-type N-terminal cleavage/methylation domain-containing protein/prepilin-type processing-associated H-X9-DG protein